MLPPVYGCTTSGEFISQVILDADELAQANLILLGDRKNPVRHPKRKGYIATKIMDAPEPVGEIVWHREDEVPVYESYRFTILFTQRGGL